MNIINMIHNFYLIKGHAHYHKNMKVIESYNSEPGLVNISEKYKITVVQVYEIMREYRLHQLNKSVILASKGSI